MQAEHKEWVDRKYPNQPPEIPAAGCVEEAGELLHAVLKLQQIGLWGEDARYTVIQSRANLVDAIGDCGIYACSLCNANEWDFEEIWRTPRYYNEGRAVLQLAVELVAAAAHMAALPKSRAGLCEYVARLKSVAHAMGIDATTAVEVTWTKVRER